MKVIRTEGESQGQVNQEMDIDEIHEEEWEDRKEKMREEKIPLLMIEGANQQRGIEACRIQDMVGEYYVWRSPITAQTQRSVKCMNHAGQKGVIIGSTKVWTNSKSIERRLRDEIRRRSWRIKRGMRT